MANLKEHLTLTTARFERRNAMTDPNPPTGTVPEEPGTEAMDTDQPEPSSRYNQEDESQAAHRRQPARQAKKRGGKGKTEVTVPKEPVLGSLAWLEKNSLAAYSSLLQMGLESNWQRLFNTWVNSLPSGEIPTGEDLTASLWNFVFDIVGQESARKVAEMQEQELRDAALAQRLSQQLNTVSQSAQPVSFPLTNTTVSAPSMTRSEIPRVYVTPVASKAFLHRNIAPTVSVGNSATFSSAVPQQTSHTETPVSTVIPQMASLSLSPPTGPAIQMPRPTLQFPPYGQSYLPAAGMVPSFSLPAQMPTWTPSLHWQPPEYNPTSFMAPRPPLFLQQQPPVPPVQVPVQPPPPVQTASVQQAIDTLSALLKVDPNSALKRPAPGKPDNFTGKENVRDWLSQMQTYLQLTTDPFPVLTASTFLKGEAYGWWRTQGSLATGLTPQSWEIFEQLMLARWVNQNDSYVARQTLAHIK